MRNLKVTKILPFDFKLQDCINMPAKGILNQTYCQTGAHVWQIYHNTKICQGLSHVPKYVWLKWYFYPKANSLSNTYQCPDTISDARVIFNTTGSPLQKDCHR